ncbi:MAG: DUF3883 domain-containing protein [Chloroflexota bacterium]|nr:DUF3883 domain-containing protein [Chloroflexota bacterium]
MSIHINPEKFESAHARFLNYMLRKSSEPFVSFKHKFFVDDEIEYKHRVYYKADELLQRKEWEKWRNTPGRIIEATKRACQASNNLLDHKRGPMGFSETALYRVKETAQIESLERHLFDFFHTEPFPVQFDNLASFLRENSLGCKWDFISYLAFLHQRMLYFPIRSTYFDAILEYYGSNERISGFVSWKKYSMLLELADILKTKLILYGNPDMIELHSYIWVVSYLIRNPGTLNTPIESVPNFDSLLTMRTQRAKERERIGLQGEKYVYDSEKRKLRKLGRPDLENRVKLVSANDDNSGYDVCSFSEDGKEIHIEVKTTSRIPETDHGFWLSDNEKSLAEQDPFWTICRVWSIDTIPSHRFLGNVVMNQNADWQLKASTWFVERIE